MYFRDIIFICQVLLFLQNILFDVVFSPLARFICDVIVRPHTIIFTLLMLVLRFPSRTFFYSKGMMIFQLEFF